MISVIIPTLNAENEIEALIRMLKNQSVKPDEIIVVDSESDDDTLDIVKKFEEVKIIPIKRKDFDHGGTRDMALRKSKGDFVLFLTQDALPLDENYIAGIIKPFKDEKVAVVSGKQVARADATIMEKCVREFNYPDESNVRTKDDIKRLGIKTFFCSDVCSAYNKSIYLKLGGFEHPLKTNEDMFFAASAINAGFKVCYAADAKVIHSHNLTLKEQYQRNYIQGIEIEKHKELLNGVSANAEGMKMVKSVSKKLLKGGHFLSFIHFGFDCVARLNGSKKGRKEASKIK